MWPPTCMEEIMPPLVVTSRLARRAEKSGTMINARKWTACLTIAIALTPLMLTAENEAPPTNSSYPQTKHLAAALKPNHSLLTPDMCKVRQPVASSGYIAFCLRAAPSDHPMCPADSRREMFGATSSGLTTYFEPLDCSWHVGRDPRQSGSRLTAVK